MKTVPRLECMKNRLSRAFTITELMVSMSVLMVVLASVLSAHLFGMRLFQITKAKLGANQDARVALSKLTDEVRAAKWIQVGTGGGSQFTEAVDGTLQQGNAIQIYSTPTTQPYVRYFLDTNEHVLKRLTSSNSAAAVLAHSVSNNVVFASENGLGTVLTNNENNRVISLTLKFYQIQYPIIKVGPGEYYDYYQLTTRITRRALE